MNNILWQILLQVLLIGLNAIFACAEIAVLSVNETKLERMPQTATGKAPPAQADRTARPVPGDDSSGHHPVRLPGQRLRGG